MHACFYCSSFQELRDRLTGDEILRQQRNQQTDSDRQRLSKEAAQRVLSEATVKREQV